METCEQYRVLSADGSFDAVFYKTDGVDGYAMWLDRRDKRLSQQMLLLKPCEGCWMGDIGGDLWASSVSAPCLPSDAEEWVVSYPDSST